MIKIIVDGQAIVAAEGATVLEAAKEAGIYIPYLCYHPDLSLFGGCRVCRVDVNGKLVIACRARVEEGMVVLTDTPAVNAARKDAVKAILARHNPDCQSCVKNSNCELQRVSAYVGITEKDLEDLPRSLSEVPADSSNPFFDLDHTRCILCGVCIRTCKEINGVAAIGFKNSGKDRRVGTQNGLPLAKSACESCGECAERCPTGALAVKAHEQPAREVKTVCAYCGVGCEIYLGVRGDRVVSVRGDRKSPVNRGQLCVKGRYGFDFINHPDRLTTPLIKRDGEFVEATWDEALDLVAAKYKEILAESGPGAIGAISSARCTVEDNYLFSKLNRSLGTNNLDHCARL